MKFIAETVYAVTYSPNLAEYTDTDRFITHDVESAILMCRERYKNCRIREVKELYTAYRESTKTITVDV